METRPGSLARALVDLIEWICGYIKCAGHALADWSGFPDDVGNLVMYMLAFFAFLFGFAICVQILEAVAVRCHSYRHRRRQG